MSSQATTTSQSQATQESVKSASAFKVPSSDHSRVEQEPAGQPARAVSAPALPKDIEIEDEPPRTYATEDTPLTGISRVSSLSSLTR